MYSLPAEAEATQAAARRAAGRAAPRAARSRQPDRDEVRAMVLLGVEAEVVSVCGSVVDEV